VKSFLKILGHIWLLPVSLVSAIYIGGLWAFRQVRFVEASLDFVEFRTVKGTWLSKTLEGKNNEPGDPGWLGWSSGAFIVLRHDAKGERTIPHESRHVKQQMIFGILSPFLYFLISIFIFCFMRNLHSYYDNPFEVDARRFAGQRVKIPREAWGDPNDRWAWW